MTTSTTSFNTSIPRGTVDRLWGKAKEVCLEGRMEIKKINNQFRKLLCADADYKRLYGNLKYGVNGKNWMDTKDPGLIYARHLTLTPLDEEKVGEPTNVFTKEDIDRIVAEIGDVEDAHKLIFKKIYADPRYQETFADTKAGTNGVNWRKDPGLSYAYKLYLRKSKLKTHPGAKNWPKTRIENKPNHANWGQCVAITERGEQCSFRIYVNTKEQLCSLHCRRGTRNYGTIV